jgi:L-asparaginase II
MLALAKLLSSPLEGYPEIDHPVQQHILHVIADMCCLEEDQILIGRDGCSVVTFGMTLESAALGWARFAAPGGLPPRRRKACLNIFTALHTYPAMVAGPDRFDTDLMDQTGDRVVSKAGAEAFQALGIPPGSCSRWPHGLGVVLKISDGDRGKAARAAVTLETLKQLDVLTTDDLTALSGYGPIQSIHNQRGILVGEGKPCFQLQFQENNE